MAAAARSVTRYDEAPGEIISSAALLELGRERKPQEYAVRPTHSANISLCIALTVLDVPGNQVDSDPSIFSCQLHVSWPYPGSGTSVDVPTTNKERYELMHAFAKTWSEPFRSLVLNNVHPDTEIKRLDVLDWAPPLGLRSKGQVVLMGDAFHLMSMCKSSPPCFLCSERFCSRLVKPSLPLISFGLIAPASTAVLPIPRPIVTHCDACLLYLRPRRGRQPCHCRCSRLCDARRSATVTRSWLQLKGGLGLATGY